MGNQNLSRRDFLKRTGGAAVVGTIAFTFGKEKVAAKSNHSVQATVINLMKCDGCKDKDQPACVSACRTKNMNQFPKVEEKYLQPYWPQKSYEDYSGEKETTNRLTPYNWTFVDEVEVEENGVKSTVHVPRRCMHCENPSCLGLCPFGAIDQTNEGNVCINEGLCMGGAKCRDVCPWGIPQRQAGVGLYTKLLPELVGGGVMYKCDGCQDLVRKGESPACVTSCPKGAITFGEKEDMKKLAYKLANEAGGYVYGDKENGGTNTYYVSKVPFEKIHAGIIYDKQMKEDKKPGRPGMEVAVENRLDTVSGMAMATMVAPIAAAASAGFVAYQKLKGEKSHEETTVEKEQNL